MITLRPFLTICDETGVMVMTYNVLAQALIRRDQYTTNGNFIRWAQRSKGFTKEVEAYSPHILLLQEVDNDKHRFWASLLQQCGYAVVFHSHRTKKQGVAVAWKASHYSLGRSDRLSLDDIAVESVPRQCETNNVALLVELHSRAEKGRSVIVGTTHLYWHPDASYERSRQMLCLLNAASTFNNQDAPLILGGDFNTESFDPPYVLATGGKLNEQAQLILRDSIRAEAFAPIKPKGPDISGPTAPPRHNPNLLEPSDNLISALMSQFTKCPVVCTSAYAAEYQNVHPANANAEGEPCFTNWTDDFRATLDYILLVRWKGTNSARPTVAGLLRLPERVEMGPEPSSLPRASKYPSDHLALMANLIV